MPVAGFKTGVRELRQTFAGQCSRAIEYEIKDALVELFKERWPDAASELYTMIWQNSSVFACSIYGFHFNLPDYYAFFTIQCSGAKVE